MGVPSDESLEIYSCSRGKTLVVCDGCGLLFCAEDYLAKNETHVCLGCIEGIK